MIYKGTSYTERIEMRPIDSQTNKWIELRRSPCKQELEVFLCDDHGNTRDVWSWSFNLPDQMTYEQIKFNVMENMFGCENVEELAEVLDEVFVDGFTTVLLGQ